LLVVAAVLGTRWYLDTDDVHLAQDILGENMAGVGTTVGGPGAASTTTSASPTMRTTDPPTARVKTRKERAAEYLGRVADAAPFDDDASPQSHAFEWIVHRDVGAGRVEVPAAGASEHRFVQRYALAVLYYATADMLYEAGHQNFKREFDFLSDKNECEWYDKLEYTPAEEVFYYGVSCDDRGRVTSIVMRE